MKIDPEMTDDVVLELIGERIAALRLGRNLTQQQLADQAGLGLRTVQRLESGEAATQLSGFVRICRVLGLVARFEALLPEAAVSPLLQLKLQGRTRKRATGKRGATDQPRKWTWGDPA